MPLRQFTCLHCSSSFISGESTAKYCGRACYDLSRTLLERNCLQCGKRFAPTGSTIECCSKACAGILRRTRFLIQCAICGKEVSRKPSNANPRYCSRKCQGVAKQRPIFKACLHCNSSMRLSASQDSRLYCSVVCKYAELHDAAGTNRFGRKNGRGSFACAECGDSRETHRYLAERRQFCSRECVIKYRLRTAPAPQVVMSCLWCGESYKRAESYLRHNQGRSKFCSRACCGAYVVRYRQNRISLEETRFLDALEQAGLRFVRQVRVSRFIVDARCLERNVVIEFDGEYWHSLKHIQEKDERKAVAVAWAGYKLVRVAERDWLDDPDGTIRQVLEEVGRL
jgi:very-short-patch-repair endonuclease/endogenous inhibitor of DNA gyrase (YacG/DUF329 family)